MSDGREVGARGPARFRPARRPHGRRRTQIGEAVGKVTEAADGLLPLLQLLQQPEVARHHNGVSSCRHRVRGFGRGRASSSGRCVRPEEIFQTSDAKELSSLPGCPVRTLVCGHGWDVWSGRPLAPVRRGSRGVRGDIFARVRPLTILQYTLRRSLASLRGGKLGQAEALEGARAICGAGGGEVSAKEW